MDWIGIGLIGLFVASFTLLMSLFRHMALVYWQPAIVFLCILWAVAVDYVAKRALPDGYRAASDARSS